MLEASNSFTSTDRNRIRAFLRDSDTFKESDGIFVDTLNKIMYVTEDIMSMRSFDSYNWMVGIGTVVVVGNIQDKVKNNIAHYVYCAEPTELSSVLFCTRLCSLNSYEDFMAHREDLSMQLPIDFILESIGQKSAPLANSFKVICGNCGVDIELTDNWLEAKRATVLNAGCANSRRYDCVAVLECECGNKIAGSDN